MANIKIILFLSPYKSQSEEKEYMTPDGGIVRGTQTNDAPVKYLLQSFDVSEIICIATDEAKEYAYKYFEEMVQMNKSVLIKPVHYDSTKDFSKDTLPKVLECIADEDIILMDSTGGFRNDNIHLLLINQILTYKNIKMGKVVYSNYMLQRIEELETTINLFSLVTGMQEFLSTGSTKTLWSYYEHLPDKDEEIHRTLQSIDELRDAICLCSVGLIDERLEKFNQSLCQARTSRDPIFNYLISVFQNKFGERMDLLNLIQWCVDSSMIQQALTIYNEKLPAYIFENKIIIPPSIEFSNYKEHEDVSYARFVKEFLELSATSLNCSGHDENAYFKSLISRDRGLLIRNITLGNVIPRYEKTVQLGIDNLVLFLKLCYSGKNNSFNKRWDKELPKGKEYLARLNDEIKDSASPKSIEAMLNKVLSFKAESIYLLLKGKSMESIIRGNKRSTKAVTIDNLEELAKESGYIVNVNIEKLQRFCRDYLYIKMLRNIINHASSEGNDSAEYEYLLRLGYKPLDEIRTIKHISTVLLKALENVNTL